MRATPHRTSEGVGGIDYNVTPAMSRIAITQGYASSGDATLISGLTANAARVFIGATQTTANAELYEGYKTAGEITGKGAFLYLLAANGIPNTIVSGLTAEECYDIAGWDARVTAVGGAAAIAESAGTSGLTWVPLTFTPVKPSGDSGTSDYVTRGQLISIPAGAQRVVRFRWTKDNNASSRTLRSGLMQRPASGTPDDVVLFTGPSLISPQQATTLAASLVARLTTRDPIVLQQGRGGADAAAVFTECVEAGMAAYPFVSTMILDIGGNDITNNRPYTGLAGDGAQEIIDALDETLALMPTYPYCQWYLAGITYRDYILDAPSAGDPAVNGLTNPENGSAPYIANKQAPWLSANRTNSWDATLGVPRVDRYSWSMRTRASTLGVDGIHFVTGAAGTAGQEAHTGYTGDRVELSYAYDARISASWAYKGSVERFIAARETIGNISAADKASIVAAMAQWPLVENAGQTTARAALTTRLNAISVV
jgi:hypothetical protein